MKSREMNPPEDSLNMLLNFYFSQIFQKFSNLHRRILWKLLISQRWALASWKSFFFFILKGTNTFKNQPLMYAAHFSNSDAWSHFISKLMNMKTCIHNKNTQRTFQLFPTQFLFFSAKCPGTFFLLSCPDLPSCACLQGCLTCKFLFLDELTKRV